MVMVWSGLWLEEGALWNYCCSLLARASASYREKYEERAGGRERGGKRESEIGRGESEREEEGGGERER